MISFIWPKTFDYEGHRFTLNRPRSTVLEWDDDAGAYVMDDAETATIIWSSKASIESQLPEEIYHFWNTIITNSDDRLTEGSKAIKRTMLRLFTVTKVPKEGEL